MIKIEKVEYGLEKSREKFALVEACPCKPQVVVRLDRLELYEL
jgi:hypothetical protein